MRRYVGRPTVDREVGPHPPDCQVTAAVCWAQLPKKCARLLLVVDEVGYIPFESEAANLLFQLVGSRYERASLIVVSNKPFERGQFSPALDSSGRDGTSSGEPTSAFA